MKGVVFLSLVVDAAGFASLGDKAPRDQCAPEPDGCKCIGNRGLSALKASQFPNEFAVPPTYGDVCAPNDSRSMGGLCAKESYTYAYGESESGDWCEDDWCASSPPGPFPATPWTCAALQRAAQYIVLHLVFDRLLRRCYVDPLTCKQPVYATTTFADVTGGNTLFFSYKSCKPCTFAGNGWVGKCECTGNKGAPSAEQGGFGGAQMSELTMITERVPADYGNRCAPNDSRDMGGLCAQDQYTYAYGESMTGNWCEDEWCAPIHASCHVLTASSVVLEMRHTHRQAHAPFPPPTPLVSGCDHRPPGP